MKVTFWGTRGSLAAPGPETVHYGGNTVCVEVRGSEDHAVILDAGTGIRRLGAALSPATRRIDLLLSHLHMDHIIGLGFFAPLHQPDLEVHMWGPASTTLDLGERLARYLSPPLFPVHVRELECRLTLHDVPLDDFELPGFRAEPPWSVIPGPRSGTGSNTRTASSRISPITSLRSVSAASPIAPIGRPDSTSRIAPTCSSTTPSTTGPSTRLGRAGVTVRSTMP